jgi:dipeptidyl-peptidase-4
MQSVSAEEKNSAGEDFLRQYSETWRLRLGFPTAIRVRGDKIFFLRAAPRKFAQTLLELDVPSGSEREVVSAQKLTAAPLSLTPEEKARLERLRQAASGISSFDLDASGATALIPLGPQLFVVDIATGAAREIGASSAPAIDARLSPNGRHVAVVRGRDLAVVEVASGQERVIAQSGSPQESWGAAEFVAQEEMGRMEGYWWSPDSAGLLVQHTDVAPVDTLWIGDAADPSAKPQPWRYPRAGTSNAVVSLWYVSASGEGRQRATWDQQRWPYLATVRWSGGAKPLLVVQNRAQSEMAVLELDPATGATTLRHLEEDPTWVNIDQSFPVPLDANSFLWASERSGSWQVERRGARGEPPQLALSGECNYREAIGYDPELERLWVLAHPSPIHQVVSWLDLSRSRPKDTRSAAPLDPAAQGVERGFFEPGERWLVREVMPQQGAPRWEIWDATTTPPAPTGKELRSVAEEPLLRPNVEWLIVSDARLQVALVLPSGGAPASTKLPVLLNVYGGPHHQTVTANARRYALAQWWAERGWAVVHIDGRGTPGRGREWERAIYGKFSTVPLEDQLAGLEALLAQRPELDGSRVAVFGWSFGGYLAALAALEAPELVKAAVAGAPVTDWTLYDTHYTERYLGVPSPDGASYEAQNLTSRASKLAAPLLLVHGTADDNVYFSHTLKFARALFDAGRQVQVLPLAGETHGVSEPQANIRLYEAMARFLESHR